MKRFIISFIIFAGLLFVGIAIMIKPAAFVFTSEPNGPLSSEQLNISSIIPREIIILGSALTISGLLGLSIQGFFMFNVFDHKEKNSN